MDKDEQQYVVDLRERRGWLDALHPQDTIIGRRDRLRHSPFPRFALAVLRQAHSITT